MAAPPTEQEPTLAAQPSLAQTGWLLEARGTQCEKNPQTPHDKPRSFPFDAYPAAHTYSKPDGKV